MTNANIAELFEHRERAKREYDAAEAAIRAARPAYAKTNGLLAYPTIEAMRRNCVR